MAYPLVPAKTQFDGGPLASQNCTATSGARLMRYATGINVTGSAVRAKQSDQSGGTSIPDIMRALHRGWSFEPEWAAPNDSNNGRDAIPANRRGDWITPTKLKQLLDAGYMVIVQGDYGNLPLQYREQATFRDDHAFTADGWEDRPTGDFGYVVDTIPKAADIAAGYDGRWIPWSALMSYTTGLSGAGRVYAAWAKPLPDTSTGEPMSNWAPGMPFPVTVDADTLTYDANGKRVGEVDNPTKPFLVVGESTDGKRFEIAGAVTKPSPKRYVDKARVNRT